MLAREVKIMIESRIKREIASRVCVLALASRSRD
jgi:hypothetical protein